MTRALDQLGALAVDRARERVHGQDTFLAGAAMGVLAGQGTGQDDPTLLTGLERACEQGWWYEVETAEPFVTEGLHDCESSVRARSAAVSPASTETRRLLRRLRDDPLEDERGPDCRCAALGVRGRMTPGPDPHDKSLREAGHRRARLSDCQVKGVRDDPSDALRSSTWSAWVGRRRLFRRSKLLHPSNRKVDRALVIRRRRRSSLPSAADR